MAIGKLYAPIPTSIRRNQPVSQTSSEASNYSAQNDRLGAFLKKRELYQASLKNKAREQVKAEFVTDKHMPAMEEASRKGNFAGSFLSAGGPTLAALNLGRAAKGHNILEKTIKPGSLKAVYGEKGEEIYKIVLENNLAGIVGAWGGPGKALMAYMYMIN